MVKLKEYLKFIKNTQEKSLAMFVSFVIGCFAIETKAMKLDLPTDDELREFILEFEEQEKINIPEILELGKVGFARILLEAIAKFFGEFPAEGYRPLSVFTDTGIEIQNASTITLLEDERGEPFLNVKVFRDSGDWVFNGYVNVDKHFGYFVATSLQFLVSANESDELVADEKFKESLIETTMYVMEMAMRRMPKWIELMVDSFESQIELIWAKQIYDSRRQEYSLLGLDFPRFDFNISRQKSIRAVESKIREFLQDDTGFDKYLRGRGVFFEPDLSQPDK